VETNKNDLVVILREEHNGICGVEMLLSVCLSDLGMIYGVSGWPKDQGFLIGILGVLGA
jgi:hypothetical protein